MTRFSWILLAVVASATSSFGRVPHTPRVLTLAILPFEGAIGEASGSALTAGLINAVMRVPTVNIRSLAATRPYASADSKWKQVAQDLDASVIVRGRAASGGQLDLTIVHIETGAGSAAREQHLTVRGADIRDVMLQVIDQLAPALRLSATAEGMEAARSEIPSDADAVPAYLELLASAPTSLDGWDAQRQRAERLVSGSERFPAAHVLLGEAHAEIASRAGATAGVHYSAAERALQRGLALDGKRPQTARALASLYAKVGRTEDSLDVLRPALVGHPHMADLHSALGYACRYAGLMEASIAAYRRAQALDASPRNLAASEEQIAKSLVYSGAYDAALASQTLAIGYLRAAGEVPDEKVYFYQGLIELYRGNRQEAVDLFATSRETASSLWSDFALAYRAAVVGARADLLSRARDLEKRNLVDGERRLRLAHLFALAEEDEASLEHLDAAVNQGFFNYPYIANDPLLSSLHDHPRHARVLERAKQRHEAFRALLAVQPSLPTSQTAAR